ncbi:MAG: hypothetical protein ACJZ1Y_00905 [Candidatus Neomarinimicrobiota bacterium]
MALPGDMGRFFSLNLTNNLESQSSGGNYISEEINTADELLSIVTVDDAPVINKRKKEKKI